ncbi:MAG: sensory box protein [Labilithrix sp.]|nr:sensory box protein [Labilithrix sp.]
MSSGEPIDVQALSWALGASSSLALATRRDRTVVFANDAARARWPGATAAPLDALFPDDARGALAAAEAAALAGDSKTFEWGEHGPAGIRGWFICTVSPLREPGGEAVAGFLCVSNDITEQKRTELRLRRSEELMVDTQGVAHLGTWDWDISQPHATWSAELYRIYGLTPETYTPSYDAYLGMVHPDDRQRVIDATNRVFKEHIRYSHDERIFRPDGSMRYLHTWAHPVLDDSGKLTRLVGVCQDITDQKLAEEQVNQLNADLERRVAERTRTIENTMRDVEAFNATLSHDLRAPLSVIQLSCEVILRSTAEPLPASVVDNLARIQRSTVFMTALVNDLLTLAHVGHATIERTDLDLSKVSEEILADLKRSTPERDASIRVEPGLRCVGDPALIRAAMENLLGNAWKYSSRVPRAEIEVGAATATRPGARAFFVRDNGAGFDMNEAKRLFAPFERLHKSSEFEGTGVGLTAVHRIIERHGGRIWAESAPGQGAAFFFEL